MVRWIDETTAIFRNSNLGWAVILASNAPDCPRPASRLQPVRRGFRSFPHGSALHAPVDGKAHRGVTPERLTCPGLAATSRDLARLYLALVPAAYIWGLHFRGSARRRDLRRG